MGVLPTALVLPLEPGQTSEIPRVIHPGACTLRKTCDWRVVLSSTRVPAYRSTMSFRQREWQRWGETKNATEVFEGYLRRLLRRETDAPELPCACEARSEYLMLKVFLDWTMERPNVYVPPALHYLTRLTGLVGNGGNFNRVDALGVFQRLGGKVLCLLRNPLTQYISLLTSALVDDWHCFGGKEECAAKQSTRRAMEIDPKAAADFVFDGLKMERLSLNWEPVWSARFDEVMANPVFHLGEVYQKLGARARTIPILAPHVQTLDPYALISNADEAAFAKRAAAKGKRRANEQNSE